tara:strand:+ start:114 stop:407 length:294 start_codon:yes stop_codon:yes gene_type:complete
MAKSHFTAKFRFMRNKKKSSDKAPDFNLVTDYTVEEAVKAAEYLKDQALKAQLDGTTVRIYSGPGKYEEKPGFSVWGSMWGDPSDESASGKISPLKD